MVGEVVLPPLSELSGGFICFLDHLGEEPYVLSTPVRSGGNGSFNQCAFSTHMYLHPSVQESLGNSSTHLGGMENRPHCLGGGDL